MKEVNVYIAHIVIVQKGVFWLRVASGGCYTKVWAVYEQTAGAAQNLVN